MLQKFRLWEIWIWVACPALLLMSTAVTIRQNGFLDPYIYAGYVHDYEGTIARFGQTYYSARIAYIFPERFFSSVFGVEVGYFSLRLTALSVAVGAMYLIARRYTSVWVAAFIAVWLCFIPWLLRSILWTHYEGFAAVYLMVALACLVVPVRPSLAAHAAAGAALALAVNCNLFLVGVAGVFAPSWWILYRHNGFRRLALLAGAVALGFVVSYIILNAAYRAYFADPSGIFIEGASLGQTRIAARGDYAAWWIPLSKFAEERIYIPLIPLALLPLLAILLVRPQLVEGKRDEFDRFSVASCLYLLNLLCLEAMLHFYFKVATLSLFYYLVYLLPACGLALIALAGNLFRSDKVQVWSLGLIGLSVVAYWLFRPALPVVVFNIGLEFWLALFSALVAAALLLKGNIKSIAVFTGAVVMSSSVYLHPQYNILLSNFIYLDPERYAKTWTNVKMPDFDWDVFRGALFLQNHVGSVVAAREPVTFWYSNDATQPGVAPLNSIHSMYLWGYTRAAPTAPSHPGMPSVDDATKESVMKASAVVLLAPTVDEITTAEAALKTAGFSFYTLKRARFNGKVWGYHVAILRLKK